MRIEILVFGKATVYGQTSLPVPPDYKSGVYHLIIGV